ncbi:FAD-binding oxidoreductase [Sphingopyxis sp. RIFCSPHIGHO2_12_FULL_65_19]|uniref:FAD-binding oxidoreductase n=1 Tax=Sphingopyxis sp. RIFCSPHIGHO2_12_FULL_65_19 TaxID=1802172 RepID=UPI0025FEC3E0|nr:FAD-binding oxidoreductase [Sphingopyxis sp. RIFCSPHIGHO2_12_FULL_65_19]
MTIAQRRSVRADLAAFLDPRSIVPAEDAAPYERGYRYGAGRAACVVRPGAIDELRAVVDYCVRNDVRFVVQGANTGLVGASNPDDRGDQLLVNLDRLAGVEDIDPLDRSAVVLAGTRLSKVNEAARVHGLCFPIDLGADPTIGGMIATNTGGSRMLRFGDVRDNLLGLEVVLADTGASAISNLSGLRKDNSGLDWKHLFVGTGGTFGVVTRARVKLHTLPTRTTSALIVPQTQEDIPQIVFLLEAGLGDLLHACEGMSRNAMRAAFRHNSSLRSPFADDIPPYALLVEVGTSLPEGIVADLDAALADVLAPAFSDTAPLIKDVLVGRSEDFWAIRHSISDGVARSGLVIAFDISVKRPELPAFRAAATRMIARDFPMLDVYDFGHCGDGGDHFNLVWSDPERTPEAERRPVIDAVRRQLYDLVVRDFGGTFSAEHGVGPSNQEFYDRYTPEAQRMLSSLLKEGLDAHGLIGNIRL